MLFLRVEHSTDIDTDIGIHIGPYNSSPYGLNGKQHDDLDDMRDIHCDPYTHPIMRNEFDLEYLAALKWCCGFTDSGQAAQWFKGYFELLNEMGFVFNAYELVSVRNADKQAICLVSELAKAIPISTRPLTILNSISEG